MQREAYKHQYVFFAPVLRARGTPVTSVGGEARCGGEDPKAGTRLRKQRGVGITKWTRAQTLRWLSRRSRTNDFSVDQSYGNVIYVCLRSRGRQEEVVQMSSALAGADAWRKRMHIREGMDACTHAMHRPQHIQKRTLYENWSSPAQLLKGCLAGSPASRLPW